MTFPTVAANTNKKVQLNLSTKFTLGRQESGRCSRRGGVVETLKQESMFGLFAKQNGCCSDVAVIGGLTVKLILTYNRRHN